MATQNSINANSTTPLAVANGGTASSSVTTSPTASSWSGWDANKNISANSVLSGYATTATAAGTTTLTVSSAQWQFFTGSTTQTVQMPVTSTLVLGQSWTIVNQSTGLVTIQSSGSNTISTVPSGASCTITCILTSGTTAASWYGLVNTVVDEWVSYTPTFSAGFGTVTSISMYSRRVGANLEINGRFTTGTVAGSVATMTLGYQGTNSNVTSSNTVIPTLIGAGNVVGTIAFAGAIYVTVAPNVGVINFGIQNGSNSALAQANGSAVFNSSSVYTIQCSIPIANW